MSRLGSRAANPSTNLGMAWQCPSSLAMRGRRRQTPENDITREIVSGYACRWQLHRFRYRRRSSSPLDL
jgi:hypothetical protein